MQRPPLKLKVQNLEYRLIIDVDGPEALSQWCLELALLLCGRSQSFTAVSSEEWAGTIWIGLGKDVVDEVRILREESRVLLYMDTELIERLLGDAVVRYRTGRGWNESDAGPLTVTLTGTAWQATNETATTVPKRRKR